MTNLCKFFIDGGCLNENCTFAHSKEEMNAFSSQNNPFWKTRKCRSFHTDKVCMYGIACLYKHELQGCKRKRRHFYIPTLSKAQIVYDNVNDTEDSEDFCLTGAHRLPVFESIHAMYDEEETCDETESCGDSFIQIEKDDFKLEQSCDEQSSAETDLDSN